MIQEKRKNKKAGRFKEKIISVLLIVLVLFFVGFLVFSNWRIHQRRSGLIDQIHGLEQELERLEKRNQELQTGLLQLSDQDYLEQIARERLGLKKPGEEVVVVLPPPEEDEEPEEEKKGFWQKFWERLGF